MSGASIPASEALAILSDMGYDIPGLIVDNATLHQLVQSTGRMSPEDIAEFISRAGAR